MTASRTGLAGLDIVLDRQADVPIGVQLAWALRSRILEGSLAPQDRLPGLRDLAGAAGVNVNTVRAVYQRLEREGLVETRQGSGTFVTAARPSAVNVADIAATAALEAQEAGVDPRDVAAALYVGPGGSAPAAPNPAAGERRQLRRQIAALEHALAEMQAGHPHLVAPPDPERPEPPTLLDTQGLEAQQTELIRRLGVIQAALAQERAELAEPAAPEPAKAKAKAKSRRPRRAPSGGVAPAGA